MDSTPETPSARPGASQRPDSLRKRRSARHGPQRPKKADSHPPIARCTIDTTMIASMQPGPGGTKTHTSSSGEPRPSQAACEAYSQVVTAVAPVEISENHQNRRDTHRAGPPDPCEPAPRVAPCHMFALFEVTARCPIETSRSLDTRGVATAKPQLFPPYSTTICVVLSPRAAFAERRTPDTVRPAPPPGAPFFRPGRSIKKRAVGAGTVPNPIRHRQEATDHGAPSKFRGTVEALHHDKGNPTPPDPTPPVENF